MDSTESSLLEVTNDAQVVDKLDMETAEHKQSNVDSVTVNSEVREDDSIEDADNPEPDEKPPVTLDTKTDMHTSHLSSADNCDICINTANKITTAAESRSSIEITKKAFELTESVNSQEDTTDESNDEDMQQFLNLMGKAERKNQRKISAVTTLHLGSSGRNKSDWRNVQMEDHGSDTSETDDEDNNLETRKFLSLMGKAKQVPPSKPMVTIKWQNGKVVGLPSNIKVTRVSPSEEARKRHEDDLMRRRREHLEIIRREGPMSTTCSGKRKFEDRMTLSEAKAEDFTDTKDYVDFIQAKLKNVNIKLIK